MMHKLFKYKCKRIEPLLWEYAGGRLPVEQRARMDAHLARCLTCKLQLQTIMQIGQGLETIRQAPIPTTQTNWAEVQARLTVTPTPSWRGAERYRVLKGVGMAAAMALLWVALVPHNSRQPYLLAAEKDERPVKQSLPWALDTSLKEGTSQDDPMAYNNSFLRESGNAGSPYATRPVAPAGRLIRASMTDMESFTRGRRSARRGRRATYQRGLRQRRNAELPTRDEGSGGQQDMIASAAHAGILMPAVGSPLSPQVPNYVLTDVEAESEQRARRTYVMDCISLDAKSQSADEQNRIGEERAW